MAVDILMPNLGFDTRSGRLLEWLKQPGDTIQKGEAIALIESDKANVELEAIASGVLLEQLCISGDEVPVGTVIARVGSEDELPPQHDKAEKTPPAARPDPGRVSPLAQRVARETGVDLQVVRGSGPHGRITRRDVESHTQQPTSGDALVLALPRVRRAAREAGINLRELLAAGVQGPITMAHLQSHIARGQTADTPDALPHLPQDSQEVELSRIRQQAGKRLSASKREAPHFYVAGEFDLEAALARLKAMPAPQPRINDLIQYLTVQALLRTPQLNATYHDGRLFHHTAVHLAVAVAREDGLVTPVLRNAHKYSLIGLAESGRALVERTRSNRLQPADLQDGTFTISNLGVVPYVDQFTAVINPPQVAILAVGAVRPRPLVVDGGLHVRHTVHLMLSGDHRAVDGMDLARFLQAFHTELDHFVR